MVRPTGNNLTIKITETEIDKKQSEEIEVISKEGKNSKGNLQKGQVIKKGSNCTRQIHESETVILPKYSGCEVEQNGDTIIIVNENDIIAKEV